MKVRKRGKKYFLDYYAQGRRFRQTFGENKAKAEDEAAMRRAEILQGRSHLPPGLDLTFEAFSREYMEKYSKGRKRAWQRDEVSLKKLNPFFGSYLLGQIKPFLIQSYIAKRQETVKDSTINRELALMKSVYSKAIDEGLAVANPVKKVKLLREEKPPIHVLTREEVQRLLDACTDYFRPFILIAYKTGMRSGEIRELKWPEVDLAANRVTVLHGKGDKRREIIFDDELHDVLAALKAHKISEYVFVSNKTKREISSFKTAFHNALRKSGLPKFTMHTLRHTYASRMLQAGADIRTVQENLGHASIMTTQIYLHSSEEAKRKAVLMLKKFDFEEIGHKPGTVLEMGEKTQALSH